MTGFNRLDLSKTQVSARRQRRYMALLIKSGPPTPAGTPPRRLALVHARPPAFVPMRPMGIPDLGAFLSNLLLFKRLPWLRRRQGPDITKPSVKLDEEVDQDGD